MMTPLSEALSDLAEQLLAEGNPVGEQLTEILNRQEAREQMGRALDSFTLFVRRLCSPVPDAGLYVTRLHHEDWRFSLIRAESWLMDDALRAELRADREAAA